LKLVKGQLARDEIPIDTSSTPLSLILLHLKIRKEKIQKPNNLLKIISSQKKIIKYLLRNKINYFLLVLILE
jgi:hypothetical protein